MAARASNFSSTNFLSELICSICLEQVVFGKSKAITKLICGHIFHLACIGSEFNVKGSMICPNCRMVEDSEWLFSGEVFENNEETDEDDAQVGMNWMPRPNVVNSCLYHGEIPPATPWEERTFQIRRNGRIQLPSPGVHFHQHSSITPASPSLPSARNNPNGRNGSIRIFNRILNYGQILGNSLPGQVLAVHHRDPHSYPDGHRPVELNLLGMDSLMFGVNSSPIDPLELTLDTGTFAAHFKEHYPHYSSAMPSYGTPLMSTLGENVYSETIAEFKFF